MLVLTNLKKFILAPLMKPIFDLVKGRLKPNVRKVDKFEISIVNISFVICTVLLFRAIS